MDGYGRVSRRQGRSGPGYMSPQVQREGVERWAQYHGVEIAHWHFDEDQSGGTQKRPGLRAAISRIERGEVQGLVCLKLSRFGRNVVGALDDVRRIRDAGGDVVFVEDQISTDGPTGQLLLTVMFAFAEWERENMRASFDTAKQRAIRRGAYVAPTPYGYERQDDGTLAPHPEQAEHITTAFRLASSRGVGAARDYLEANAPERRWTAATTRRTLARRAYLGEIRIGDQVRADGVPALVTRAIFEAAQHAPRPTAKAAQYPLSGLAKCGTCGVPMAGHRSSNHGKASIRAYRCAASQTLYRGPERCPKPATITAHLLEGFVREQMSAVTAALRATIGEADADGLALAERALTEAEAELDAFAADLTLRRALGGRYADHLAARVKAIEEARRTYGERNRHAMATHAFTASDVFESGTLGELSELLRGMLQAIVVAPGRGNVARRVTFVPIDADLPAGVAALKHA